MNTININKKAFVSSVLVLLVLMILAGVLTNIIPAGRYERQLVNGRLIIDPDSFQYTDKPSFPIWRWFVAPIEVLWSNDAPIVIAIIIFLLVIGGAFAVLNRSNLLSYLISKIVRAFGQQKYLLLASIVFAFMMLGSVVGIFEEIIPLIPIIVALSYSLGWDSLTGLGMSFLATGFGFASGIANPFTIGVAQKIAGLPLFSGIFLRVIVFVVMYTVLSLFLIKYAKRIEKNPEKSLVYHADTDEKKTIRDDKLDLTTLNITKLNRASGWFVFIVLCIFLLIFSASIIEGLADYSLLIIGLLFLIGGLGSGLFAGLKFKTVISTFFKGTLGISPGILMILMATSVKHIITRAGIMDSILHYAAEFIINTTSIVSILLIYLLVLIMNFFIGSGSAKAFLIMPIVIPLVDLIGINRQIAVLAFAFGDGFSNVIYPTNAVLLISMGLTTVSYPNWFKWIIKLQLLILVITSILLLFALVTNYGPF